VDSWLTTYSGRYARIYVTDADKNSGTSVTTWSRGTLSQSVPAYSGISEVSFSTNWVYIRSSGLGSHVMGPWYLNAAHTMAFPNLPINSKSLYRIPRAPATNGTHTLTGLGAIGYFVDGVAMFDSRDAFYWNGSTEVNGSGSWNRDAYVNESVTFDPAYAHQPGSGQYHYHANPPALRYLLGDHVDFSVATKGYSESTNAVVKHSPSSAGCATAFRSTGHTVIPTRRILKRRAPDYLRLRAAQRTERHGQSFRERHGARDDSGVGAARLQFRRESKWTGGLDHLSIRALPRRQRLPGRPHEQRDWPTVSSGRGFRPERMECALVRHA
jgi:hypothetical protein